MAATEKQLEKVESEMNAFERSTLRWTKATFVVFAGTMVFVALQWIAMHNQLAEMKSGGIDPGKLAVSAGTQAEVATKTMHVDQRAWMNVSVGQAPLQDGQPIKVPIRIVNTGKTPSYRVQGLAVINLLKEKEQPDFNYGTGFTLNTASTQGSLFRMLPRILLGQCCHSMSSKTNKLLRSSQQARSGKASRMGACTPWFMEG